MKSRWIAAVVCMLYMSISTVFAAVHHHDADEGQVPSQCAACAWHHSSTVDVPSASFAVYRPATVLLVEKPAHTFFRELSLKIHPSRGPPVHPL